MRKLRDLQVVSPCQEDWTKMSGTEQKRFCEKCQYSVYDFSEMTEAQGEAALQEGPSCVRLVHDQQGNLLTKSTHHQSLLQILRKYAASKG